MAAALAAFTWVWSAGLVTLRKPTRPGGSMSCTVFKENGALPSGPIFWAAAVRAVKMEAGNTRVKEQTMTINLARRPPAFGGDFFLKNALMLCYPLIFLSPGPRPFSVAARGQVHQVILIGILV